MLVSLCVRNTLTSFMGEKVRCIRNTSENLFQMSLLLLQFSAITPRGFAEPKPQVELTGIQGQIQLVLLSTSYFSMSSLTKRSVDSKRDTPWPTCLFRRSFALGKKKKKISLQVLAFFECCVNIKTSQALSHSWSCFVRVQAGPSSQTYINNKLQELCLSYPVSQLQRFSRALLICFSLPVSPEDTKRDSGGAASKCGDKKPRVIL